MNPEVQVYEVRNACGDIRPCPSLPAKFVRAWDYDRLAEENKRLRAEVDTIPSIVDHAVAVERERCARICEKVWAEENDKFATGVAAECAAAIRRGEE